jgi:hypothetical protein
MNVQELINQLSKLPGDTIVLMANQPIQPIQHAVSGITYHRAACPECGETKGTVGGMRCISCQIVVSENVHDYVYILEGSGNPNGQHYAPRHVFQEVM